MKGTNKKNIQDARLNEKLSQINLTMELPPKMCPLMLMRILYKAET